MPAETWNLIHVITKLELGGAQLATLHEVEHSRFCNGKRYLLHGPGGLLDREAHALRNVECIEVPALERPIAPRDDALAVSQLRGLFRRLRRQHRDERFLVHTHSSKAGILGRWAARAAGIDRIVHSIHGFGHNRHQAPALRYGLLGAEQATAVITDGFTADSEANIRQAREEGIAQETPTRVVRCGVDVPYYATATGDRAALRTALGLPLNHVVVLNLSVLKAQKDPKSFVRVARRVVDQHPQTTFLLAGDGDLRPRIEKLIASLELDDHVRLLGWRRDVPDLLGASDLLLLTSLWEGLPQAFPQAMAAGLPIVATRVDGAPEAVTPEENGLLCEPGDVEGLASAVLRLVADAELRRRMGVNGRSRAQAFSVERMVEDLDAFYEEVATAPARWRERARHLGGLLRYWRTASMA